MYYYRLDWTRINISRKKFEAYLALFQIKKQELY